MKSRYKAAKGTRYSYEDSYDDADIMFSYDDSYSESQRMLLACGAANVVGDHLVNPSKNTICRTNYDLVFSSYQSW